MRFPGAGGPGGTSEARRAAALPLRLDQDGDLGRQPAIHLDRDLVRAERLQRLLEIDLVAVDLDPAASERVGDVLRRDRAVELAALADLDAHGEGRRGDPGRGDLRVGSLADALVLAARDVVLPRSVCAARGRDG